MSVRASNSQMVLSAGVQANRSMVSYRSGGNVRGISGVGYPYMVRGSINTCTIRDWLIST